MINLNEENRLCVQDEKYIMKKYDKMQLIQVYSIQFSVNEWIFTVFAKFPEQIVSDKFARSSLHSLSRKEEKKKKPKIFSFDVWIWSLIAFVFTTKMEATISVNFASEQMPQSNN